MTNSEMAVLAVLVAAGIFALALFFIRRWRLSHPAMDDLDGHDFEYYCADLLKGSGFRDVEVTRGSGDFGADILCEKGGVTYAVQCKCYDGPVGVIAVQEIYAGRDWYECMVGAVMTNQYFTEPAKKMADKLHILLWDRDVLEDMRQNSAKGS